jgi:Cys/Met metabolism PLP-dependent enzyme
LATGVSDGYVRLSVGIEHIDDIIVDLERGFVAAGTLAPRRLGWTFLLTNAVTDQASAYFSMNLTASPTVRINSAASSEI